MNNGDDELYAQLPLESRSVIKRTRYGNGQVYTKKIVMLFEDNDINWLEDKVAIIHERLGETVKKWVLELDKKHHTLGS